MVKALCNVRRILKNKPKLNSMWNSRKKQKSNQRLGWDIKLTKPSVGTCGCRPSKKDFELDCSDGFPFPQTETYVGEDAAEEFIDYVQKIGWKIYV